MRPSTAAYPLLALLILPIIWWCSAGDAVIGFASQDLEGHLWTLWNATRGPMTHTDLVNAPHGVDLLPIVGGWLDIRIGSWLAPWLGVARAYNTVLCLYVLLAGLGGALLARSLGAIWPAALVSGLVLQLDPFILLHLAGGRPEQASLGIVALALAGAVGAWRSPDRRWIALAGIAGALVVYASWELAILLCVGMVLALPILARGLAASPGVARRWGVAAGITALLAGPWVAWFLTSALAVRSGGNTPIAIDIASHASIGWVQFWLPTGGNPGLLPTIALLSLPFFDTRRRRLWLGVWAVLVLSFVLGLGPAPSRHPGIEPMGVSGPFSWLQHVPVLRWFHWPDRVVSVWGVLGAGAIGAALTLLAQHGRRRLSIAIGALAIALALVRIQQAARWPTARFELPQSDIWQALRDDDHPGAIFDLPVRMRGIPSYAPALAQIQHHRPVRSYGGVPWLLPPPDASTVLPPFSIQLDPRRPVTSIDVSVDDLDRLRAAGFGYISLQRPQGGLQWYRSAAEALTRDLGEPTMEDTAIGWTVWRL